MAERPLSTLCPNRFHLQHRHSLKLQIFRIGSEDLRVELGYIFIYQLFIYQLFRITQTLIPTMTYISAPAPGQADATYGIKNVCRIIGFVCIFGFLFDIILLGLPPQSSIEWRIGFVQEFANRSIIFLFGMALVVFGSIGRNKSRVKLISKLSMGIGIFFFLLCFLSVVDSIKMSKQATTNISAQESQIQTQIREAKANPAGLPENVALDDLEQFSRQLTQQADSLKKNTKRTVFKTGISNIGNLFIVGVGLLGLGRSGMKLSRTRG